MVNKASYTLTHSRVADVRCAVHAERGTMLAYHSSRTPNKSSSMKTLRNFI